ncbi:MAG: methyltransferase domain-containing protein [Pseudomonadota bacterium]
MQDEPENQLWTPRPVEETRKIYAEWAESYDSDVAEWGYATPGRIAMALRRTEANVDKGVLDYGCGTGLCGMALRAVGFDVIDGTDISPEMLEKAHTSEVYRALWLGEPGSMGHVGAGDYAAIAACGVVSLGAAPPETLDLLVEAMAPGTRLAFSFNEATMADRSYTDRLDIITLAPDMELIFEEDGPHLPAKNMSSTVYVLQRS